VGFDFRQHVAGLVSVFLALVVGIFIGIALSRQERVEVRMNEVVEESKRLGEENVNLRGQLKEAEREVERRAALEKSALPGLVGGQLTGAKIALIYIDDAKRIKFECELSTALMVSGANIVSETTLSKDFEASVARIKPTQSEELGTGPDASPPKVAARVAELVVACDEKGLRQLSSLGLARASSSLRSVPQAVVVFAQPRQEDGGRPQAVDIPLLNALEAAGVQAVVGLGHGVPDATVALYRQKGVVVIESADTIPGQVELVGALHERLRGGAKAGLQQPLALGG